jgi:hypothetical protein
MRGVARGAGVVTDAGVGVVAPGNQLVEGSLRGGALARRETHRPRPVDRDGSPRGVRCRTGLPARSGAPEDDELG